MCSNAMLLMNLHQIVVGKLTAPNSCMVFGAAYILLIVASNFCGFVVLLHRKSSIVASRVQSRFEILLDRLPHSMIVREKYLIRMSSLPAHSVTAIILSKDSDMNTYRRRERK